MKAKNLMIVSALSLLTSIAFADNTAAPTTPTAMPATTTAPTTTMPAATAPTTTMPATTPTATTTTTTTAPSSMPSIAGNYNCKGHDPFSNNDYNNTLSVSSTGNTYTFEWTTGNTGYPSTYGTGITNPSAPNVIAVTFWDPKDSTRLGNYLYQLQANGSLQGSWTMKTQNQLGTETCTKS